MTTHEKNLPFILKDAGNWAIWKLHIQTELCNEGVVDHIFDQPLSKEKADSYVYDAWNRRDQKARAVLRQHLSPRILLSLTQPNTNSLLTAQTNAHTLWQALLKRFEGLDFVEISKRSLEHLLDELTLSENKVDCLDNLITGFMSIVNELKELGHPKSDSELADKLFNALPTEHGDVYNAIYLQWMGLKISEDENVRANATVAWILDQLRVARAAHLISAIFPKCTTETFPVSVTKTPQILNPVQAESTNDTSSPIEVACFKDVGIIEEIYASVDMVSPAPSTHPAILPKKPKKSLLK